MARPKIHLVTYYCFWFIWKIEDLDISTIIEKVESKIFRRCLAGTNNQSVFTPCLSLRNFVLLAFWCTFLV